MRICHLDSLDIEEKEKLLKRSSEKYKEILPQVLDICREVKNKKDSAVIGFIEKFDNIKIDSLVVERQEIENAYKLVSDEFIESVKISIKNVKKFHESQIPKVEIIEVSEGIKCWKIFRPIQKVGLYIPGGRAPYPSGVIMNGVPAKIAGCEEIIMCAPPNNDNTINPFTLVAADLVGIKKIFKIGGAQAIAAMAYGTESVPKVYKIFGAGNLYVTAAKMSVFGQVNIDLPAGPSEVFIIADETANPKFVAADLLSQAEHDVNAAPVLLTTSEELAKQVEDEVLIQSENLATKSTIEKSMKNYGTILICKNIKECIDFTNEYAPEHLEIMTKNYEDVLKEINNAGSIFLGDYSSEPAGDYASGTNHVLPTGRCAKMFSPLSLDSFLIRPTVQILSKEGLSSIRKAITNLADAEGFVAHKNAIEKRFE